MTTGISLVRENTASMEPPRALWVPFPLGRPLGIPNDPEFQHAVIAAALDLLNRSEGPVLKDFPHDAPTIETESLAACPVAFPKAEDVDDESWSKKLSQELALLQPWYELSCRRKKGRTLVGIAEDSPDQNIARLAVHLDNEDMLFDIRWLKPAVEDLKAFYQEAMTAQPGDYDAASIQSQFWQETALGQAILLVADHFQKLEDDHLKLVARMLAPREAVGAATGPTGEQSDD